MYPKAPKKKKELIYHGDTRIDNYYYMNDIRDISTRKYIDQENKYANARMKPTQKIQNTLYDEFLSRTSEDFISLPIKQRDYYYFYQTKKSLNFPFHYRSSTNNINPNNKSTVLLLDENKEAKKYPDWKLFNLVVSPDQREIAYVAKLDRTLFIKNIRTGKTRKLFDHCGEDIVWKNGKIHFIKLDSKYHPGTYCILDTNGGGGNSAQIQEIYKTPDHFLSLSESNGKEKVFLSAQSYNGNYAFIAENSTIQPITPVKKDVKYFPNYHDGLYYFMTNDDAINYKITSMNLSTGEIKDIIPSGEKYLRGFAFYRNFMVVDYFEDASPRIMVMDMNSGAKKYIEYGDSPYNLVSTYNILTYDTDKMIYIYNNPVTPDKYIEYDMKTGKKKTIREIKFAGHNPSNYKCQTLHAEDIPITIVYKKQNDTHKGNKGNKGHKGHKGNKGQRPLLLQSYGAYGVIVRPRFNKYIVSLLDRGFIFGIAHVRGGGILGEEWYQDGKLKKKKNTFRDLISCVEYLIKEGYTTPEKLVLEGRSAGGLTVGAAINDRPELFTSAIMEYPFVDCLTTMLDPSIPLTIPEWEEWGNPLKYKTYYEYIGSYSPYDNIAKGEYPNIFLSGSVKDQQVGYYEPLKYAAKMRALNRPTNLICKIAVDSGSNHHGSNKKYEVLRDVAYKYAWVLSSLFAG